MVEHANTAVLRQLCRVLSQTIPFQHILFYLIKVDLVHRLRLENMREVSCGLLHRAESRELSGDRRQHLSLGLRYVGAIPLAEGVIYLVPAKLRLDSHLLVNFKCF